MKKVFLVLATIILMLTSCSSDDDNYLESINQTEWEISAGQYSYSIYFSTDGTTVSLNTSGQHVMGTFIYDEPTAIMDFSEDCSNDLYFFSNCNINGNIDGDQMTIIDSGEEFIFNRINQ